MQIKELAAKTGLSTKAIRFYEKSGILPPAKRLANGYRTYEDEDVERVRFVAGARHLNFSLDDINEILSLRDQGEAPCRPVLDLLAAKADEIAVRIGKLQQMEQELRQLHTAALDFPIEDIDGKQCVCHLLRARA